MAAFIEKTTSHDKFFFYKKCIQVMTTLTESIPRLWQFNKEYRKIMVNIIEKKHNHHNFNGNYNYKK